MTLAWMQRGEGPTVVFLHGFAGSRWQWQTYVKAVAAAGFRGYAVDLPGHGDSPEPPAERPASPWAWATPLLRWLEAHTGPGPIHLVGHSLGGYLALAYALHAPQRVASLTLFTPLVAQAALRTRQRVLVAIAGRWPWLPARWPGWVRRALRWSLWFYPEARRMSPAQRQRRVTELQRMSPRVVWAVSRVPDLRPRLRALSVRTWVIGGARDSVLRPASYAALGHIMPNARVTMLPHAGHIPHLTEAAGLRAQVVAWLNGRAAASVPHTA